jgi:deoxyribose-phosphate aldolase
VCVNPVHVARCAQRLRGSGLAVISGVGFPLGATYARCKALECGLVILDGATEVDMVMNLSAAVEGDFDAVEADARAVVEAAAGRPVKLIIETGLLNESQKVSACQAAARAGIAFVKTCSGFAAGTATVDDVALLRRTVGDRMRIKASGGIRGAEGALALLAAGADRLGTSAGVQIVRELDAAAH